ncbi:alpha/beta hydrolase [Pseudonocardiaceae bacterium YIM PH 21723]|nr:alpha/beta hydrolase [Pseudonocardiaceae bacterium YIM PH 21723]
MVRRVLVGVVVATALAAIPLSTATVTSEPTAFGNRPTETVTYAKVGDRELKMDIYRPAKADKPTPVVMHIHGGAWKFGTRRGYVGGAPLNWGTIPGVAEDLTQRGYTMVSVDYRLTGEAKWPAQIHDVKAATRFLRANAKKYNLDPTRFAAWGESAGAHLSAMLGTTAGVKSLEGDLGNAGESSAVQAVVDWFGPTDMASMDDGSKNNKLMHGQANSPEAALLGCKLDDCDKKLLDEASPLSHVSGKTAPFIIQHGKNDHVVPFQQSIVMEAALKKAGVPVEFQQLNSDHEFLGPVTPGQVRNPMYAFLDKQFKN